MVALHRRYDSLPGDRNTNKANGTTMISSGLNLSLGDQSWRAMAVRSLYVLIVLKSFPNRELKVSEHTKMKALYRFLAAFLILLSQARYRED